MRKFPKHAFILAAGFGSRLKPLTNFWPKALLPIVGIPALKVLGKKLYESGITQIAINTHYHNAQIESFASKFKIKCITENKILGTAGGLGNMYSKILPETTVLVHNCDIIESFNLLKAYEFHKDSNAKVTLITIDNNRTNNVITEAGTVIGFDSEFLSKNSSIKKLTYSGVGFFNADVLDSFSNKGFVELTEALKPWVEKGLVRVYDENEFWLDFGDLKNYLKLHQEILVNSAIKHPLAGKLTFIESDVKTTDSVYLKGFVYVSSKAKLHPEIYLENCIVFPNTIVETGKYENCIIFTSPIDGETIIVKP
jgi:mannose-1-phosphate guanylyltransferase